MFHIGKCPHCNETIKSVGIEAIDVTESLTSAWKGVSFHCPSCKAVLSVGIDPIALKTDIVGDVVDQLFERLRKGK